MYVYIYIYATIYFSKVLLAFIFWGLLCYPLGIKHGDGKYIMYICDLPIIY